MTPPLRLQRTPWRLAVCRFAPTDPLPVWALHGEARFYSITRTPDELSVVCAVEDLPPSVASWEGPWAAFVLDGPIPFTTTGVISGLTQPLAEAGIPVFVLSTHDTDYLMVREDLAEQAAAVLATRFEVG